MTSELSESSWDIWLLKFQFLFDEKLIYSKLVILSISINTSKGNVDNSKSLKIYVCHYVFAIAC